MSENTENLENALEENPNDLQNVSDEPVEPVEEEEFIEEPEPEPIQQVFGVYYYDKIFDNGMLGQFTESTQLAYQLGWQDNVIQQSDTEKDFFGHTYVKGYAQKKSLEYAKIQKLAELKSEADKFEQNKCSDMVFISSLGFPVDGDRRSVQNVEGLIRIGEPTDFKCGDNVVRQLSVAELETIQLEMDKNGDNLYRQKFVMEYTIAQLQTVEEVENYPIVFNMMDFSQQ